MDKRDQQFRKIMKSYQPPKAPVDFSKKVMNEIQIIEDKKTEYKPVFGKWVIRFMISGFAAVIIYAIFSGTATPEPTQNPEIIGSLLNNIPQLDLSGIPKFSTQIGEFIGNIPSVVGFTFLTATLLLFLDLLILERYRHTIAS